MYVFLGLLFGYIVALLLIGWYVGRGESEEDYLIAGRDRPWWQILCSKYAANVGAGFLLTNTAFAYEYGAGMIVVYVIAVAGVFLYAYWAGPRIYRVAQEMKCYTQGDYVYAVTKSLPAKYLINIAASILALIILVISVSGGATLMEQFEVFSYEVAVFLTLGIVLTYIYASGYKAVMITDVLQAVMMLILLTVVLWGIMGNHAVDLTAFGEFRSLSPLGMAMISLFGVVGVFAYADRYQITYASKDESSLKKGMLWVAIPFIYTVVALYTIGIIVYAVAPQLGGSQVYVVAIQEFLPVALMPFALLIFFAALMSSADSYVYVLASHTQMFFSEQISKRLLQVLAMAFGLAVVGIALVWRDVVDLAILSAAIAFAIAFPMIYLILGYTNEHRFFAMLFLGLMGVVVGVATIGLVPDAAIVPFLGVMLGLVLPSQWTQRVFAYCGARA